MNTEKNSLLRKVAAIAVLPTALLGISGCTSGAEDELPVIVEDEIDKADDGVGEGVDPVESFERYTGVYNKAFYDDVEFYVGEEVILAAIVGEVISPHVFTIVNSTAPPENGDVDVDEVIVEPLLVVHEEEIAGLIPGMPVGVIGIVGEAFYPDIIQQDLQVDLGNEVFQEWEAQPYVEAVSAAALIPDN